MDDDHDFTVPAPPTSDDEFTLPGFNDTDVVSPQKRQRTKFKGTTQRRKRVRVGHGGNRNDHVEEGFGDGYQSNDGGNIPIGREESEIVLDAREDSELPFSTSGVGDDGYDEYVECILAGSVGFFQIEQDLFVVQGWDPERHTTRNTWSHVHYIRLENTTSSACFCGVETSCVHIKFLRDFGSVYFPGIGLVVKEKHRDVGLFLWEIINEDSEVRCSFSVASESAPTNVKARAIVHHHGPLTSCKGEWMCSSDRKSTCSHITRAMRYMARALQIEDKDSDVNGILDESLIELAVNIEEEHCISHLVVPLPNWCSLPGETSFTTQSPALKASPAIIRMDSGGQCMCRAVYNGSIPCELTSCVVYGLSESFTCQIEVQRCHKRCSASRLRYIGPDCGAIGLFNYNNKILLAHDLLDDYTAAYTSSETPFASWIKAMGHRYSRFNLGSRFVREDLFRSAWFMYAKLLAFGNDMCCSDCGPEPSIVIFDGVTLAFGQKHVTASLSPPTTLSERSTVRGCSYTKGQTIIGDKSIRTLVRKAVTGRRINISALGATAARIEAESGEDSTEEIVEQETALSKAQKEMMERIQAIPLVQTSLLPINPSLSKLFEAYCGMSRLSLGLECPISYCAFFKEIASEESIVQLIAFSELPKLYLFVQNPAPTTTSELRGIPCLYDVLIYEEVKYRNSNCTGSIYPLDLLNVICWLANKANDTFKRLIQYLAPGINEVGEDSRDWMKTGCLYHMSKIRDRPRYPGLKHDQKVNDGGKLRSKCSKYYATYKEQKLTGGIMVAWCTHSIAYGFHCIPKSEGRNDVFSALLTHWRTAPRYVIYDFACALAPYCMTREPDFFKETHFLIDDTHAEGHSKCSPSSFLKTYARLMPHLAKINSSAAECGNSGILRIRKSVSYMRQDRAIIYTQVYLAVWNRLKTRKLVGIK